MPSLELELSMFLAMVLTGAGAGVVFDFFASIPAVARARGWRRHVFDLLLWLLLIPLVLVGFVLGNWGDLRFYVPLGLVLGLVFYELAAARAVRGLFRVIFTFIAQAVVWLGRAVKVLTAPWRSLYMLLALRLFPPRAGPPGDPPPDA